MNQSITKSELILIVFRMSALCIILYGSIFSLFFAVLITLTMPDMPSYPGTETESMSVWLSLTPFVMTSTILGAGILIWVYARSLCRAVMVGISDGPIIAAGPSASSFLLTVMFLYGLWLLAQAIPDLVELAVLVMSKSFSLDATTMAVPTSEGTLSLVPHLGRLAHILVRVLLAYVLCIHPKKVLGWLSRSENAPRE